MKRDFIYFDWNVVKDLKDNNVDPIFFKIIENLKNLYVFPFSFAHLCDRQKKMSVENIEFIREDMIFFNNLSDGYMLGRYGDEYDIARKDIFQKFDEVTIAKYTQYPNPSIPQEVLKKVKQVGFSKFFEDKQNIQLFPLLVLSALNRFECDYELYKQFREAFKLDPPEEIRFFSDLQKPDLTSEELKKITECFIKDDQFGDNLRLKVGMAYLLLDFNPQYNETVNSKSNFTNMYNDREHMLNASFARYYITKDKKTIKKTKLIYDTYGINTGIYNIEEFINLYET